MEKEVEVSIRRTNPASDPTVHICMRSFAVHSCVPSVYIKLVFHSLVLVIVNIVVVDHVCVGIVNKC